MYCLNWPNDRISPFDENRPWNFQVERQFSLRGTLIKLIASEQDKIQIAKKRGDSLDEPEYTRFSTNDITVVVEVGKGVISKF